MTIGIVSRLHDTACKISGRIGVLAISISFASRDVDSYIPGDIQP